MLELRGKLDGSAACRVLDAVYLAPAQVREVVLDLARLSTVEAFGLDALQRGARGCARGPRSASKESRPVPEPIPTVPARLVLSPEEQARVCEIVNAVPEEAADVHTAVIRLLFDVMGALGGRLQTPWDVDATLVWLADAFPTLLDDCSESTDVTGTLALMTRHAMVQARDSIVRRLVWERRN